MVLGRSSLFLTLAATLARYIFRFLHSSISFYVVFSLFFEDCTCPNTPPLSEHRSFPLLIKCSRVIQSFRQKEVVMNSL